MKATAEIQIDKPIDDVWAFVSNIENMDRWVDGIEAPKQTSESGGGTVVSNTVEVGSDSWMTSVIFVIGGPLIRKMMRGQVMKELKSMKREIDGTEA